MNKVALICGISGQDGAYLAKHLLSLGYEVCGTSRNVQTSSLENLKQLGIFDHVRMLSLNPLDPKAVEDVLAQVRPGYVYNLAGQTSVGLSFQRPLETIEGIALGTLNLLEGLRLSGMDAKVFNAGSVETFGETNGLTADERTPLSPSSPYAIAKAAAYWTSSTYRKAYGMFVCTGILSNHESPIRPPRFVTRKIVNAVARISLGSKEKLNLGNVSAERDWGWASEYMDAAVRILQNSTPDDYIIATGETRSLLDFVQIAFSTADLNWVDHVVISEELKRPTDVARISVDPSKAKLELGWQATIKMKDVVRMMLHAEIDSLRISKVHCSTT